MTREETKKLIFIMTNTFPNYHPSDLSTTVDIWADMLSDNSYEECATALKVYMATDTTGFAPSIGQLLNKIPKVEAELTEMEAWSLVGKALRNSIYHAKEEFEALPEVVQRSVGSADNLRNWAMTDEDSVENVIQSNFLRSYRVESKRHADYNVMPSNVKALVEKVKMAKIDGNLVKMISQEGN